MKFGKDDVVEIFRSSGRNGRISNGLSDIWMKGNKLTFEYRGNMGASIERCVDPILERRGFPKIVELKKTFKTEKESGSPDYMYHITFNMKCMNEPKIS